MGGAASSAGRQQCPPHQVSGHHRFTQRWQALNHPPTPPAAWTSSSVCIRNTSGGSTSTCSPWSIASPTPRSCSRKPPIFCGGNFGEFRPETNFGAWACRVAYLETLKFRERRKGELRLSPEFLERIAQKATEVSDLLELRADVFNYCMDRLSEPDRQLITRRYAAARPSEEPCRGTESPGPFGLEVARAQFVGRCWSASIGGSGRRIANDRRLPADAASSRRCCTPCARRS